jgi:hypothetical protein
MVVGKLGNMAEEQFVLRKNAEKHYESLEGINIFASHFII